MLALGRVAAVFGPVLGFILRMATQSSGVVLTRRGLQSVDGVPDVPRRSEPPGGLDVSQRERSAIETDAVAAAIERAQRDRSAFAELYDAYFARVYGYVAARLGSRSDAEDVVADTFVRALDALPRFEYRGQGSFAAWLFASPTTACLPRARRTVTQWTSILMLLVVVLRHRSINPLRPPSSGGRPADPSLDSVAVTAQTRGRHPEVLRRSTQSGDRAGPGPR